MRSFLATTTVLLALATTATAAEFTGENASFVGADLVGRPVSLGGDLVLEIDGGRGLIRDYTNPASPAWVGAFAIDAGLIERGAYRNGVFIGLHSDLFRGATLFDLADPAVPTVLSSTFAPYHFTSAVLRDHLVYLTTTDWLVGYDLTDPTQPALASLQLLGAYDGHRWPALAGDLLYLVDGVDRVRVFDLAAPGAPTDLGTITLPTRRLDALAIAGGYLYTLQAGATAVELTTYDLAAPLAPVPVDAFALAAGDGDATGTDLVVTGEILYATTSADRLRAFSLAAPAQPAPGFELLGGPRTVVATDHALLLHEDDEHLRVLERTAFDQPPALIAERRELPDLAELETNGRVSVAVDAATGDLLLIDVADPRSPAVVHRQTGVNAREVAIDGNLVAACSLVDIWMFDIADPRHPALLSLTRYPEADLTVRDCALADGLLAVGLPSFGTLLYDVADPTLPRLTFTMRQVRGKLELAGGRLLTITGSNRASVYDVSDPASPQWFGLLSPGGVRDAALSLGRVAMLTSGGLLLFQINGNGDYDQLSQTPVANASRLTVAGHRVYAFGTRDAHIVNVADPLQPAVEGWFEGDGTILALVAASGLIHVDIGLNSYLVSDDTWATAPAPTTTPAAAAVLLAPAPNPFNPAVTIAFEIARAQDVRLTVHDLRGRLVARLAAGTFAPGRHEVTWRGLDDGRHVRPRPPRGHLARPGRRRHPSAERHLPGAARGERRAADAAGDAGALTTIATAPAPAARTPCALRFPAAQRTPRCRFPAAARGATPPLRLPLRPATSRCGGRQGRGWSGGRGPREARRNAPSSRG